MKNHIFIKIYRVIHSCTNLTQLEYAYKYLKNARVNGYIDPVFATAIYLNIYKDKERELKKIS